MNHGWTDAPSRKQFRSLDGPATPVKDRQPDPTTRDGQFRRRLVCRKCRLLITFVEAASSIRGQHEHTFCNPHGIVFHIGCYACAPGCEVHGPPSSQFAWFPGFLWQVCTCRNCGEHLGWCFTSASMTGFFGLITHKLLEIEADD